MRFLKQRIFRFTTVALCSCLLFFCVNKMQAQTPAEKLQRLSQALNLSPEQKRQLLPLLEAEAPKINDVKNNPNLLPKQRAMEMRQIHQQSDPSVENILSAQQYKEWEAIRNHEIEQAMQK